MLLILQTVVQINEHQGDVEDEWYELGENNLFVVRVPELLKQDSHEGGLHDGVIRRLRDHLAKIGKVLAEAIEPGEIDRANAHLDLMLVLLIWVLHVNLPLAVGFGD